MPELGDGAPRPLGANWDGAGVNFALAAPEAEGVTLCLFDEAGANECHRLELPGRSDGIWHDYLAGAGPGLVYGYRVAGGFAPERGLWFNPHKLLLDPYARGLAGSYRWTRAHLARCGEGADQQDNAPAMLKGRVHDDRFDWGGAEHPETPWSETVIYELHVKGFTMRHPDIAPELRGRFAGLASDAAIAHFTRLGVTAIELLPVHAFLDEPALVGAGLGNYWGYNTVGFFAPDPRYGTPDDFKAMVKRLHQAGLEVILDVVYNHTAEADERGPTYSLRGLDNAGSYRLVPDRPIHYINDSGCGNTLNLSREPAFNLVLDSLRYWAGEMRVDGFRFDLATVLGRGEAGFDPRARFFGAVRDDPLLSRVKLIAEPWDIGLGGYQQGGFPPGWSEWNGRYRDTARDTWLTRAAAPGEMAGRLTASSDLFAHNGRPPSASVNYVTSHDGFTLADLVSYERKRNRANGHDNTDGTDDNRSWNAGVEGPSDDPGVGALRARLRRTLLACLMLSQGVPMLQAGDELGRSQDGNNNAYCQDNETSWLDWQAADQGLFDFTRAAIALRKAHARLRRDTWFSDDEAELRWRRPDGAPMTSADWDGRHGKSFGFELTSRDAEDSTLLVLLNPEPAPTAFRLPGGPWHLRLDSASAAQPAPDGGIEEALEVAAHSLVVLQGGTATP